MIYCHRCARLDIQMIHVVSFVYTYYKQINLLHCIFLGQNAFYSQQNSRSQGNAYVFISCMLSNHGACLRFIVKLLCDAVELVTCNFQERCLSHSESNVAQLSNFSFINYTFALQIAFINKLDALLEQIFFSFNYF